jgi:hypothetical protein
MKVWDKNDRIGIKQSESGDSREYYNLALYIDGNIAMFQASGDLKYLDKAFVYINNMIDDAKPSSSLKQSQFKDDFLGWSNKNKNLSKHIGKEVPLYESYCWRYVSYLLRVLRDSPTILSVEKYRNQYNEILEFTEKNIFQKWMTSIKLRKKIDKSFLITTNNLLVKRFLKEIEIKIKTVLGVQKILNILK